MAPSNQEKHKQEALGNLKQEVKRVEKKLAEEAAVQPTLRQVTQFISELEKALSEYKRANASLIAACEGDEDATERLTDEFCTYADLCDAQLEKLYEKREAFEAANRDAEPPNQEGQRRLEAITVKLNIAEISIDGALSSLQIHSKAEATLSSPPLITAQLERIQALKSQLQAEVDATLQTLVRDPLPPGEKVKVEHRISTWANKSLADCNSLEDTFNIALAKCSPDTAEEDREPSVSAAISSGVATGLKPIMEDLLRSFPSPGGRNNFGFSKTAVPTFEGDIREFSKWKSQVEDHIADMAKTSIKAALHQLDRITPKKCDVTKCATLEEAWAKLSGKFGCSDQIARILLKDFSSLSLRGATEEAKLIQLRDAWEQLHADLVTNRQEARCDDYTVLDQAEAMLPGRFRAKFVDDKDELLKDNEGSGYKALASFLQIQGSLIERHMPDRLLASAKTETRLDREKEELEKDKKIKSLQQKLCALEKKDAGKSDRAAPGEKLGKCPICEANHTYTVTRGPKQGQVRGSDKLFNCDKFIALSLEEKSEAVVKHKACASCLSWNHERPACSAKPNPCTEKGCKGNHNRLLHGSKNPKTMMIRAQAAGLQTFDHLYYSPNQGMLETIYHVFGKVNIGTVILADGGSTTSLISATLAGNLYLKGTDKWVNLYRVGDTHPQVTMKKHYTLELLGNDGQTYRVQCMEVDHIMDAELVPDFSAAYRLFPHLPAGVLERPNLEIGLLLGQNAAELLPAGGDGVNRVDNLRLMTTPLGKGWVLGGWHPQVQPNLKHRTHTNFARANLAIARLRSTPVEELFPDLADLPLQLPRSCARCTNCKQCRYEVQEVCLKEKRELDLLKGAVRLDTEKGHCVASYPALNPDLSFTDNQWQAIAMARSLEKQLSKHQIMDQYNGEFDGLLQRGTIRRVTPQEIASWKEKGGEVSYISHHPVLTPGKATTKCRIVSNSSLKNGGNGPSPNSNWPKGPNALKPMYEVFLRWRLYPVAVHFDLKKMFHSVRTGLPEMFKRLMAWRKGKLDADWAIYGWLVVAFGDRPASCILEICKDLAAEAGEEIDPEAAKAIREDTYVDDGATGGTEESVSRMIGEVTEEKDGSLSYSGTLSQIFQKAGFTLKMIVRSGETNPKALELMGGTVLGHQWDPAPDTLSFKPKVFLGKKGKTGTHSGPELNPDNLQLNDTFPWTKALLLSTIASIFDPSGIVAPLVLKYKIFLREVCLYRSLGWNDVLPADIMIRWRKLVEELVTSPEIIVRRCARPDNAVGPPILVIFTDGSSVAFGAVVYVVYKISQPAPGPWAEALGQSTCYSSSLLLAKARVAPLAGITTPRSEMNGMVLGTKLADLALISMAELPSSLTFCLDSECTIAAVDSEHGLLKCYLANRRATIQHAFSDWKQKHPDLVVEDLQHIPGPLNPADLATRNTCSAEDMGAGSLWQQGPNFLKGPREEWPVSRDFCSPSSIPDEERNIDIHVNPSKTIVCCIQQSLGRNNPRCTCKLCSLLLKDPPENQSLIQIFKRTNRLLKARGVLARVLRTSKMLADKSIRAGGYSAYSKEEIIQHLSLPLSADDYAKADRVALLLMQPQVRNLLDAEPTGKKSAKNPPVGKRTIPKEFLARQIAGGDEVTNRNMISLSPFAEDGIWYTRGRFGKGLVRILGQDKLAILPPTSELARLEMIRAHSLSHMGGADTSARSRQNGFWVVRARPLADKVAAECWECRRWLKAPLCQRLGFLPEERMLIFAPPFTATSIDFLGPFLVKAMNNARTQLKVWPIIFACLNSGAVHIELSNTYGTDTLLQTIDVFTALRGNPAMFYTDRGSQLCKAAQFIGTKEDPQKCDWGKIEETLAKLKSKVKFCLPGCHWQNGLVEKRVQKLKECLELVMPEGSPNLNFNEFRILLTKCADMMNSRPLGAQHGDGELQPLTPNHLLLGRASSDVAVLDYEALEEAPERFTKRAAHIKELGRLFWNTWLTQVFPALLPFRTWTRRQQNLETGDIVMVLNKPKLGKVSYRLARVIATDADEDGLCRKVTLEARPPGGKPGLPYDAKDLQRFEMAVQRLVLIHPHTLDIPTAKAVVSLVKNNFRASISEIQNVQNVNMVKLNPAYGP